MPLRDHFYPPLADQRSWEGVHGGWPAMIVLELSRKLPASYVAEPRVHQGSSIEVDVANYEEQGSASATFFVDGNGGTGVATAVWAPPRPTLAFATNWPAQDEYGVRVYDTRAGHRLVAAIEIVSPANKDRTETRRAFVAKCAALIEDRVCVAIVDLVTSRTADLYRDLLEVLGGTDPSLPDAASPIYAVACRATRREAAWLVETWMRTLSIGQPLPTLPLWLADDLSVPVDLESSYEETCRVLRLPKATSQPGKAE
jgi:Protein of unknown function (DUF4058)